MTRGRMSFNLKINVLYSIRPVVKYSLTTAFNETESGG